ncbi:protein FAM76B-like [Haliotis rubra]|uniref:protein FAM76B-like n=1 Tax=Haliotis rubra TaxID=36100 RepID=UPI001EE5324F|nr:protein FAM76B-like [Haliotis rubra]
MAALFSCTKCHSRHPFEELSQGEQLCKDCRNNYPIVKCTYCRAEFQQVNKGSTHSICKKCAYNVKVYGKPTACEYCSVIAAFIGNKCQRCTNSEKKWGPPSTCEQCKQKCAFDRNDDSRRKVDGKLLCWLCTLAYKRVLAKAKRHREHDAQKIASGANRASTDSQPDNLLAKLESKVSQSESRLNEAESRLEKHWSINRLFKLSGIDLDKTPTKTGSSGSGGGGGSNNHHSNSKEESRSRSSEKKDRHKHARHHDKRDKSHSKSSKSKSHHSKHKSEDASSPTSPNKKARTEKNSSNGVSTPKSTSSSITDTAATMDIGSSDQMIAITQLREQLESLKKQLQGKDQQLKEKDKKINELKAEKWEFEKDSRTKLNTLQKQSSDTIDTLQVRNRELMRQVSALQKNNKKTVIAESPHL